MDGIDVVWFRDGMIVRIQGFDQGGDLEAAGAVGVAPLVFWTW
jgi:hypothetical protein